MSLSFTSRVLEIEAIIDHVFSKKRLAAEAAQMAAPLITFVEDNAFKPLYNNKRLAILGEAVLARELCSAWFRMRGSYDEALSPAQWTQLRNDMISNDSLARRGYNSGIDKVIITASSTPHVSPKMVATTLAAIMGAVHEDGGDTAVHKVMQHLGFFNHTLLTVTS
ncbi:hypothetical protein GGP41_004565 [Bipolaris sorokiniana]|uniref:RNase III domain-containing protein n=2 Tax=Cochliobolus sativus TaxID=45130 RepID=A0A8H5ZC18_COCSA|nr:uncharacterized protein COCSADRAFT_75916 [Bipolaris sorokiniana ND90Pr]EMD69446.1 hypothetical protein COCSADRAFT_75916 [Bipolaris sorokiniana ND90Pr]KAF5846552.1 hypothetical protein GGP41_004565 [Bipolaris sorokiniana]